MRKNEANQDVSFYLVALVDGFTPITTGAAVQVHGDNGTRSPGAGGLTHKGGGEWNYKPTAAETNFNYVAFTCTATGAIPDYVRIYTGTPQSRDHSPSLPLAGPATVGGLPTVDSNNFVAGIQGSFANTLDDVAGVSAEGTAQAVTANTIQLAASETQDHNKRYVNIISATTGAGQLRQIVDYNPTTKVATLNRDWTPTPTGTITYRVINGDQVDPNFSVDKFTIPGQTILPDSPTLEEALGILYKFLKHRNVHNRNTNVQEVYDAAGTTVEQKANVTDSGGITTRDGFVSGP